MFQPTMQLNRNNNWFKYLFFIGLLILLTPSSVHANMVWPPALIIGGMSPFIAIGGLLIEFLVLRVITNWDLKKCFWSALTMNLLSGLVGLIAVPLWGLGWALFSPVPTFSKTNWIFSALIVSLINLGIEAAVLRYIFKLKCTKKVIVALYLANLCSVGIVTLWVYLNLPTGIRIDGFGT